MKFLTTIKFSEKFLIYKSVIEQSKESKAMFYWDEQFYVLFVEKWEIDLY